MLVKICEVSIIIVLLRVKRSYVVIMFQFQNERIYTAAESILLMSSIFPNKE